VLDNQEQSASDVRVALYQRSGRSTGWVCPRIDNNAEISGTTGTDGRLELAKPRCPRWHHHPRGQTRPYNPFGLVDIVGVQEPLPDAAERREARPSSTGLDITSFNLAYWMGDTISHTFTIPSPVRPPARRLPRG